jgi:hypothetical protein
LQEHLQSAEGKKGKIHWRGTEISIERKLKVGDRVWIKFGDSFFRKEYPHAPMLVEIVDCSGSSFGARPVNKSMYQYAYGYMIDEIFGGPKVRKANFIGGVQVQQ